jgi:ribosomal protein L16/L10AE
LEVSTIFSTFAIDKERTIKVEQFKSAIMEKETYNYVVGLILANVGEITAAYIDAARTIISRI